MLHQIEDLAYASVRRACGFAALGILTFVVGLCGQIEIALRASGQLALFVSLLLIAKAGYAHRRPYRHTEVYTLLKPVERPHSSIAQRIISGAMREAYLFFAQHAAWFAAILLGCSILVGLFSGPQQPAP